MKNRQTLLVKKKIHLPKRINLTEEENNSLLTKCEEVPKELYNFLANVVKNLNFLTEIKALDVSKLIQESDILVKIIKANENFFAEGIYFYFNKSLENSKFPNCLKLAIITSVFKKGARTLKTS